ncbi:MAG: CBS domain-containing protein, partial [Euryarchaeota archaeon]|nr:CBS domain-containing protein [Euryarchaeota archaeon]
PNAPIADAVKTMIEKNISSVIVGSNDKEIIGMFTERDVLREVVAKGLDATKVSLIDVMCSKELKHLMCRVTITVNENAPIEEAADKMMGRYIRHLPVTNDDGKIVGMVSARTVMNALKYANLRRKSERLYLF